MKLMKKNTWIIYIVAFLIPVLVMAVGCIRAEIWPFGERTFLRNDMYHQYLQFFTSMYDKVKAGDGLAYSMQLGLGSNTASVYAYYLSSPLNFLLFLFPRDYIAEFLMILVIVKMGLCGASFAYYLRKHFDTLDVGILWFSCAYALSGYMAAYQWNVMWLDVIALAPLVISALEELISEGKGTKYCILLALSIFTNFYLSIMLCIFLVLYFVTLILWKPWSVMWRRSLQFGLYSLLSGGMTAGLLLPAYYAMSNTERTSTTFPKKIEWYMNFFEMIGRQCMKVSMEMSDKHWPNIYCGAAIFLLIPLYVLSRRISLKEKVGKLVLVVVFWISFMCNIPDFIWHGLNYPNSMPGRQGYLYIFLILAIGYEVYHNLKELRFWELFLAGAIGYGVVAFAGMKFAVDGADAWSYQLTLGLFRIYFAVLVTYCICRIPQMQEYLAEKRWFAWAAKYQTVVKLLLLLLVVAELSANMYETSIRTSNRTSYNRFYFRHYAAMEWLREQDESLFRTEVFNRKSKNDGMMWHVNTTTIFASSADSRTRSFYEAMGMGAAKGTYWYDGATPLTSAMLGVKYMIGEDDTMENDLYKLVYSEGNGYLYECNYTLPMGYVVDLFLEDAWEIGDINSIATQNDLGHLLGIEEDLFTPVESVKESNQKYTITAKEDSYVYIYLGQNNVNKVKTTVGEKSKTYSQVSFDYLVPVGLIPAGETATVEEVDTEKGFSTFEAYEVNLDVLERILTELGEESLHIRSHGEGFIKGEVTLTEPGKLVVSIPMDEGWHIYVNGKETEPETFKDMFLAVTLEEGTYDIVLEYKTPGLMPGMVISVLALVAFFTCVVFEHRKKK